MIITIIITIILIIIIIPGGYRIDQKEVEKISKYQNPKVEVKRLWEKQAIVIPVVIGASWELYPEIS